MRERRQPFRVHRRSSRCVVQDFLAVFFAVDFFAGDFFAVLFLAVDFLAGDFFAVDFFAVLFFAVDFLAGDFLAVLFFAGAFLAAEVDDFFAVDFLAGDFFAVDFFAGDFLAVLFLAVDFFAVLFFAADFFAGDFFAVDLLAVFLVVPPPAARFAAAAVRRTAGFAAFGVALSTAATVSAGSFFVPATTSLSCAPALKFGTAFFFDFIRAPVEGFRTHLASRTFFSKEPKPVMATFSPLATSRVIVSSTDSSACAAALRLPS